MATAAPGVDGCAHQLGRGLERAPAVVLGNVAQPAPGRELGLPQRLGEPHVPDPGDDRLVEQRLTEPARLVGAAHPLEHRVDPRWALEDVRPEPRERARVQLEDGAVPEHAFDSRPAEHEPRLPGARLPPRPDRPATGHAEMRAQDDAALEA
jgi:hypothetical protein